MKISNQYNLEMSINLFLYNFKKEKIFIEGHDKEEISLIIKNDKKIYANCAELIKAISRGYKKMEVIAYIDNNSNIIIPKRNVTLEILAVYFDVMKCGIFLGNRNIEDLDFLVVTVFNSKEDYLYYSSVADYVDNYSFVKKESRKRRNIKKTDINYCVDINVRLPTFNVKAKDQNEAKSLIYEKLKNTSVMKYVEKSNTDVTKDWRY